MKKLLFALIVASCAASANAQEDRSLALTKFFSELGAAAEAGDHERYADAFAGNASMFLPHRTPLTGRDAIGLWFRKFTEKLEIRIETYEQEQVDIIGDVATVRSAATGHYVNKSSNARVPFNQKYLDVLQYKNGEWFLSYHVASSNSLQPGIWESAWESE